MSDVSEKKPEVMDLSFSMFNGHVNDAFEKAKVAYLKRWGKKSWDEKIAPLHEAGIMTIFHSAPTEETRWYAEVVAVYVNEGREGGELE
jgi:hypothetical protein